MICLSTFLKDFSSENTGPISIKFYMQPLGKGGKKIYIFYPGHITKMATLLIYGKNHSKLFFSRTTEQIKLIFCMKHMGHLPI